MRSRFDLRRASGPVCLLASLGALTASGCKAPRFESGPPMALKRVVVYRNGVGYFERRGSVREREVTFRVLQRDVNDFLASLVVMERGGSSVRAAAFPLPDALADGGPPPPDTRRTVRLSLDGEDHDLVVGYTVETPIWRPSYRLVFSRAGAHMQAWGIVQNTSGEDWRDVRLSLVTGAPVSFRSELAHPVIPLRPMVTDQGAVIAAVPQSETTLAMTDAPTNAPAPAAPASAATGATLLLSDSNGNMNGDAIGDAFGYGGLGAAGTGWGGGGTGEGTIGLGNLGAIGHGSGYGNGAGMGLRGNNNRGPIVRAAPPTVQGSISPEAVRRVVLRNLGQVNHCHEQGLSESPTASGRVVVRFVIGAPGNVAAAAVQESSYPVPAVSECIANAVRRWQFPAVEGGGMATVSYPFMLDSGGEAREQVARLAREVAAVQGQSQPSAAPRSVASLAALAEQGGTTRFDLPDPVTVPNNSATMVMLAARAVQGERMFLFAPDPGVPESTTHPFQVARFTNSTGATLERGSIAIFEDGAFLGQGMLDALPPNATTTVPYALQRAVTVTRAESDAMEGARLVSLRRGALTIERFSVKRATFTVRNGDGNAVRVMAREPLRGAELYQPPAGTESANDAALAPVNVPAHGEASVVVTTRRPFSQTADLWSDDAGEAIEGYLRDAHPAADVAAALRTALDLRRALADLSAEHGRVEEQRNDLQRSTEETRQNLYAIEGNGRASDLRAQLTARLARAATEIEGLTRRIVELDVQIGERRVRLSEAVRTLDVDTARR